MLIMKQPFEQFLFILGLHRLMVQKYHITACFSVAQPGDIQIFANIGVFFLAVF